MDSLTDTPSDKNSQSHRDLIFFFSTFAGLLLLDQISKIWAIAALKEKATEGGPISSWFWGLFHFSYAENQGAFLSLGAGFSPIVRFYLLVVFNATLLLGIVIYLYRRWKYVPQIHRCVWGIILAGGIGNLIDRFFRDGKVIDFLIIGIPNRLQSGVFNLADAWITGGVLFLFILSFNETSKESESTTEDSPPNEQTLLETVPENATLKQQLKLLCFFLAILNATFWNTSKAHGDIVIYKSGSRGGQVVLTGQILEFTTEAMTFRIKTPDTIKELEAKQVIAFEANYSPAHQQAIEQLKNNKFVKAKQQAKIALGTESSAWIRRELMAIDIQCAINLGQWQTAALQYLAMEQSNSNSRNLDLIPVHWKKEELSEQDTIYALQALDSSSGLERLIAASWLLNSEFSQKAKATLSELLTSPKPLERSLSRCQLWRTKIPNEKLTDRELTRWESHLHSLPDTYWAGPMFLLGNAYEKQIQNDLASARYLWITVIDSRSHSLAREATLRAAGLLKKLGQENASSQLTKEASLRFPAPTE